MTMGIRLLTLFDGNEILLKWTSTEAARKKIAAWSLSITTRIVKKLVA